MCSMEVWSVETSGHGKTLTPFLAKNCVVNSRAPILQKWKEIVPQDVHIPYCIKVAWNNDQICYLVVNYARPNHDAATAKPVTFLSATLRESLVPSPVKNPTVRKDDEEA